MDKKILRVGIIGCGDIFHSHSLAYPDLTEAVIVGLYDRIRSRAEAWFEHLKRLMNYVKEDAKEMEDEEDEIHLKRCEIFEKEAKIYNSVDELIKAVDVIDVCAPNYVHAPYAIWALRLNKSVMTEKPPARCSLETKWIIKAAQNSQGYYQLNENFFWQVSVRELKKIIEKGKIGKVLKIEVLLGHGGPSWGWNNHFMNPSLSGGGALSDMGIHAIAFAYGIIGKDYKVKKVQSLRMVSGTKPERTMRDSDGANKYSLHKFMVEDDAKIKVWVENEKNKKESIEITIETSWARTLQGFSIIGEKGKCVIESDEKKRSIAAIYYNNGEKEVIVLPPQGRDSHQLEIIDFIKGIARGKRSYVDEQWAHEMQTIISSAYLSNLRAFEGSKNEGVAITPKDLDDFYNEILKSECPRNMLIEEIVYRFMSPFTQSYYTPSENFTEESNLMFSYEP